MKKIKKIKITDKQNYIIFLEKNISNIIKRKNFKISLSSLVSSAVERQPFKLVVEGSIPSWGAFFFYLILCLYNKRIIFRLKLTRFKKIDLII